jgi:hypothetical protein
MFGSKLGAKVATPKTPPIKRAMATTIIIKILIISILKKTTGLIKLLC